MRFTVSKLMLTGVAMAATLTLAACGGGGDSTSVDSPQSNTVNVSDKNTSSDVAPAKMGADGKYDEHGLAKRVKAAVDNIPNLDGSTRVYVAQKGSTVFLKGSVADRSTLERVVSVAKSVKGVEAVNTDGITLK